MDFSLKNYNAMPGSRFIIVPFVFGFAITLIFLLVAAQGQALSMSGTENASSYSKSDNTVGLTGTITSTTFIPLVQDGTVKYRQLGLTQVITGPIDCNGQQCFQLNITCPQVSQPIIANLKVGEPISSTLRGTILFATGWTGTYYWDGSTVAAANLERWARDGFFIPQRALSNNANIITDLRSAGYRTVQLKWQSNWFQSELGHMDGIGNLACRPATVAQWVYENLHQKIDELPYCATGHSNGASQVGYMISQYGLAHLFSSVVFESGPNWSRIDTACLHNDPANQLLYGDQGERNTIDWGFGFNNDGSGACAKMDTSFTSNFQEASLGYGDWTYYYPKTMISFVFGGADTSSTAAHGMYFHDSLVDYHTPLIGETVVPGAPHFVTEIDEGALAMENTILNECHTR